VSAARQAQGSGPLRGRMAPRYAHVHVEGDWGIRLGKGNITIEVWDKRDRRVGSVQMVRNGVLVDGKRDRRKLVVRCDSLNQWTGLCRSKSRSDYGTDLWP
jgi:hypothetical protein